MMKPKKELELLVRFQYKCLARLVSCYANIISYYYFFVILIGLNILSSLKQNLGDLDKVKRIVKLVGFVQCVDGYKNQPFVINGCSDLMFEVFGDKVRYPYIIVFNLFSISFHVVYKTINRFHSIL